MRGFNDFISFTRTLTFYKVWNSIVLRLSYMLSIILKKHIHWGKPEFLSIEPSNFCNLKCSMCPLGTDNDKIDKQFISTELYKNIIDESKKWVTNIQLFFQGEPFLNPKLNELIEYTTLKNIYSTVSTNGHFLNKDKCERIVNAGLKRLIISIDGTSQEIYGSYRKGGELSKVIKGIENINETKKLLNSTYPTVIMQFVIFSFNEHQIDDIKELANKLKVDKLQLKTAQIEDIENSSDFLPKNNNFSRYKQVGNKIVLKRKNKFHCKRIWFGAVITAYGHVLPCCFDKKGSYSQGNINNSSLIDTFKNNSYATLRKRVWENHNKIDMCSNCTEGVQNIIIKS